MGSLIIYSGAATRVKAMERWQIKDEQFKEMASLETVPRAVKYLRRFLPYRGISQGAEDKDLHRGNIEQRLSLPQHRDFAGFYRFANIRQRCLLDLYFMHHEITIIKICLRNTAGHKEQRQGLFVFQDSFERHSSTDLIVLPQPPSITESVGNLEGPPYYESLNMVLQSGIVSPSAFEATLGVLYFKTMWKVKNKCLPKEKRKILAQCLDTKMDTLNLEWPCHSKKFRKLLPGEIYTMMIPIQLYLTKSGINKMAEAETLDQLYGLIRPSRYKKLDLISHSEEPDLDRSTYKIIDRIYQTIRRKDPYSITILNPYLYFKEREIACIINTIEHI